MGAAGLFIKTIMSSMLLHAKNIIGIKVVALQDMRFVGRISDGVVDPENGAILALRLRKRHPWDITRVVALHDVIEFYTDGILIRDTDSVVRTDEVLRVRRIVDYHISLLGSSTMTQNGEQLGTLRDFIFDATLGILTTIIVQKALSQEKRIMSSQRILSILPGRVIIRDTMQRERVEIGLEKIRIPALTHET